jgi:hypothetical protein
MITLLWSHLYTWLYKMGSLIVYIKVDERLELRVQRWIQPGLDSTHLLSSPG